VNQTSTAAQSHAFAAESLAQAIRIINTTIRREDGLEWDGRLRDLLTEAQAIHDGLSPYAKS